MTALDTAAAVTKIRELRAAWMAASHIESTEHPAVAAAKAYALGYLAGLEDAENAVREGK